MAEGLVVRDARHGDVPALGAIWQELMDLHERTDARFKLAPDALSRWRTMAHDLLSRDDGFLIMAEQNDQALGFCLGWMAKNPAIYEVNEVGFISEIAVAASARRQGVGRALIQGAKRWFLDRHLSEFQLSTAVWNQEAQAFWQALGGEPLLVRYRFSL